MFDFDHITRIFSTKFQDRFAWNSDNVPWSQENVCSVCAKSVDWWPKGESHEEPLNVWHIMIKDGDEYLYHIVTGGATINSELHFKYCTSP